MRIHIESVENSSAFRTDVDVVVIGAGIVGSCTAYELARLGASVALLEKGFVGAEQSGRNWGWVRQQNRDLQELTLAMHSLRRWEALGSEIGRDLGFRRTGILFCTDNEATVAQWQEWGQQAKKHGFHSQILTGREAKERTPGASTNWKGGVWSPSDGRAEPSMAAPAIAEACKALGVSLHQNCAVRGLEVTNGAVAGVWTERGLIRASIVIIAGGAWSSRFCTRYGIALPVANIGATAFRTKPAADILTAGNFYTPGFALRRRLDGGYSVALPGHGYLNIAPQSLKYAAKFYPLYRAKLAKKLTYRLNRSFWSGPEAAGGWENDEISPFEKIRVLDPNPDQDLVQLAIRNLVAELPALQGIEVASAWGSMIDTTPDLVPVISKVDTLPGFVIAAGFSGHGFGVAPAVGQLTAQIALDQKPDVDPSHFRLSRFSDGSAIHRPDMV